jgi:predicted  nucleic acid-binding Zn-ribbon protein
MQHEIATAEQEVRTREDRILDHMEEAETQSRLVKDAEATRKEEEAAISAERQALEQEKSRLEAEVARLASERDARRAKVGDDALRLFDHVAKQRRGVGIVEARDGHCTFCHVRLRPQVFNEIRRNDKIVQCDSCLRILYYIQPAGQAAGA